MHSVSKVFLTVCLLLTLGFLPSVYAHDGFEPATEITGEAKRFKIFIAEYNTLIKNKSILLKSIFKIDLDTGTVWRYRQGLDSKNKPFEEFFEVPNQ